MHHDRTLRTCVFAPLAIAILISPGVTAADRSELRFKRLLLSKHDHVRLNAIKSIPTDFQSRLSAMPVVIDSLEDLSADIRFKRANQKGLPDLPDGVKYMIDFVGTVDRPEATQALVNTLECGRVTWAMAVVQTLGRNQHHGALADLEALLDSEYFTASYGFRFTLARSLKEMNHPDAWEVLAKMFDRVDGQLAHRIDQEFANVTLDDFKGDKQRFEAWRGSVGLAAETASSNALAEAAKILSGSDSTPKSADDLPKKMGLAPAQTASSYLRERRLKPSKYYGIDIYAKRMLFIIDRSGSMQTIVNGQSRIQRAKRELITAINGLEEECEFGILVFDKEVRSWQEQLVQANEDNKLKAMRFVEKLSAGSSTNTYMALRRSLAFDPQLEAVFLLTDGKPTYGPIQSPPAILLDILHRNEMHNITINAVAVGVEPLMASFLRKLTEPSNGEFRELR